MTDEESKELRKQLIKDLLKTDITLEQLIMLFGTGFAVACSMYKIPPEKYDQILDIFKKRYREAEGSSSNES